MVKVAGWPWTTIVEIGYEGTSLAIPKRVSKIPRMVFFCKESSELIRLVWSFKSASTIERRFSRSVNPLQAPIPVSVQVILPSRAKVPEGEKESN